MTLTKDKDEPIYTISIAAKLVRPVHRIAPHDGAQAKPIHAQTLRMYDRMGLVKPRKVGKNRFYSDRDIERLQQIQHFTQDIGINLKGVEYIFALMDQLQPPGSTDEHLDTLLHAVEASLRDWSHAGEDEE
jgi:MerR family transcriptional regulator/heat shock protein HspR